MRSLLLSIAALAIALTASAFFIDFADDDVHEMVKIFDESVTPAILSDDWPAAQAGFERAHTIWRQHKTAYIFFTDAGSVKETELSFHRLSGYLSGEDKAECAGELAFLRRHLLFLHEYEILSVENII